MNVRCKRHLELPNNLLYNFFIIIFGENTFTNSPDITHVRPDEQKYCNEYSTGMERS